ncbi:MAG TPA: hypothetical protein VES96_02295 [Nitrospiraceae bacterium]|nr:hypothetical protein [Nitrospiraceae bacterium]
MMHMLLSVFFIVLAGCSGWWTRPAAPPDPPLKIVVAPVILEAAITKTTQIHSFDEDPPPEIEPELLAQLHAGIQVKAQQFLTDALAGQKGFVVVPFDETRRILDDLGPLATPLTEEQNRELLQRTGADIVISAQILDYGVVRWQYWVTGLVVHSTVGLTIIGFATSWNPVAIGAYFVYEIPDVAIWSGGAYAFGWAFRPVRIEVEAFQRTPCSGVIWTEQDGVVKVPGKTLAEYTPEDQKRKEVQLEINLKRAMIEIAETAGQKLRQQSCKEDGTPEQISGSTMLQVLDLLY